MSEQDYLKYLQECLNFIKQPDSIKQPIKFESCCWCIIEAIRNEKVGLIPTKE